MKLPWRSYCTNCGLHIMKHIWQQVESEISGHFQCSCPRCHIRLEKYDILDEDGFGRTVRQMK